MGLIPDLIIQQVLERTDIVALINNYTPLKKAGRNFKALCPFHNEKSSSFVVNPDKQIFHCFGCGVGGNAIGFLMRQERLDFPNAVRQLADKCGIVVPQDDDGGEQGKLKTLRDAIYEMNGLAVEFYHQELLTGKSPEAQGARQYLKQRGVSLEAVKTFQLGFSPNSWDALSNMLKAKGFDEAILLRAGLIIARENKSGTYDRFRNRIMFPIFDIQSRPVAFGARTLVDSDGAKYINSPETPVYTKGQHVFGLHLTKTAVGKLNRVIVVEGYMDMIMPYVAGVANVAAALGTALTVEQIRLIRRYSPNITMLFDTDPAGQAAMIRSLDLLVEESVNVNVVSLEANEDPDSFIRNHGLAAFNERLNQAQSLFDYKMAWLNTQYSAPTIENKSLISQAMLSTINRYRDEVVKFELTKLLATRLNLPLDVLVKQSKGLKVQIPAAQPVQTPTALKPATQISKVEEMLLTLLLTDPTLIHAAKGKVTPDDFDHDTPKGIVSVLLEWSDKPDWSVKDLLGFLSDEESIALVTRLVNADEALVGDKQQMFNDCLAKLADMRKRRLRLKLNEELRLAQSQGNLPAVEYLTKQLNDLLKGV